MSDIVKTMARVLIAVWFSLISVMQLGPLCKPIKAPQLHLQALSAAIFLLALALIVLLAISIIRSKRRPSLAAAVLLGVFSVGILLNIVLLGPIAHKLNMRATVLLVSVVALNCASIWGIVALTSTRTPNQRMEVSGGPRPPRPHA